MTRFAPITVVALLLLACDDPAPSIEAFAAFGSEEPVAGVRLGMRAREYLERQTPDDTERVGFRSEYGYERRIGDSLYYHFDFDPGGRPARPAPPDTAVLTSVTRHRLVEDDADWPATVDSVAALLGPPSGCVKVVSVQVQSRWAEWREPPGLSVGYIEEVRARGLSMVEEHRIQVVLGEPLRPTGQGYLTSEVECPTGQSESASST